MGVFREKCLERNGKDIFGKTKPFPNYEILNEIAKDHNVVIVTHQLNVLEQLTLDWLKEWGINYHSIHFTKDKHLVEGDILLDDAPRNTLNPHEKSLKVIMNRPYNKELEGYSVNNVKEFYEFVKKFSQS